MTKNKNFLTVIWTIVFLLLATNCWAESAAKSIFDFDDVKLRLDLSAIEKEYRKSLVKRTYGGIRLSSHENQTKRIWLIQFYSGCALLIEPKCVDRATVSKVARIANEHGLRLLQSVETSNEKTAYFRIDLFPYKEIGSKPAEVTFDILRKAFNFDTDTFLSVKRYWKSEN